MQKILCNLTKSQVFNKEKQGSLSLLFFSKNIQRGTAEKTAYYAWVSK